VQVRTSERIIFEQNEDIEFAPGGRTHPATLEMILRRPSACGVPPKERAASTGRRRT